MTKLSMSDFYNPTRTKNLYSPDLGEFRLSRGKIDKNPVGSHRALAGKKKLVGKVFGGFLKLGPTEDYEFAGQAKTVHPGNDEIMHKAIDERGVDID